MSKSDDAIRVLGEWYAALPLFRDRLPAKGAITAALHVLERLRADYQLDVAEHVAGGEAQITGLSADAAERLLARFGEMRQLSSIGGRSNRGTRRDVASLLTSLRPLGLDRVEPEARDRILVELQRHIVVEFVSRFFAAKRVRAAFDPAAATAQFIDALLADARSNGKHGAVAEYLVGAKLTCRFPESAVRNKQFNTADAQGGHAGDFELGNTAFHVTVAPAPNLFPKMKADLDRGLRVYLLVPRSLVVGAQQNADVTASGRIAVESIESFVATNIDELSGFDGTKLRSGLRRLLETYNQRVDAVETDKSILIEVPPNLE
jgi:hypothetical protein